MGPFTSWPSSKGKKAKKLSAALTKRLVFAVPTRAEILFFGAWPSLAASFLLVHVISKAIQSTFDISRPQHHRPVSNWPIGFSVPNCPSGNCRWPRRILTDTLLLRAHRSTTDDPLDLGLDF